MHVVRSAAPLLLIAIVVGCSSRPDLASWRSSDPRPRLQAERRSIELELQAVDTLRIAQDLAGARKLALTLAAENPQNAAALAAASRAESDAVHYLQRSLGADSKAARDLAAWSALDYARRAAAGGNAPEVIEAQLAWALGTSTHLQGMFSRAGHARETLAAVDRALARNPNEPTALATLSVLRLRLATLPWIARAMAWGAPKGSIDEAVAHARKATEALPSLQHKLLLASALVAAEKEEEAALVLDTALQLPDAFPRDRELRRQAEELSRSLAQKLAKRNAG